MKRFLAVLLAGVAFLYLAGFSNIREDEYDALLAEKSNLENKILDLEAALKAYEPYQTVFYALQSEDFDGAIDEINRIKQDRTCQEAGNIEDYLIKISIDENNFEEYFETAESLQLNAFGEPDTIWHGIASKAYQNGLLIYDYGGISVEVNYNRADTVRALENLLIFPSGMEVEFNTPMTWTGRVTPGVITYLNTEYVDSVDIKEPDTPDNGFTRYTFHLKNGEEIIRSVRGDYIY